MEELDFFECSSGDLWSGHQTGSQDFHSWCISPLSHSHFKGATLISAAGNGIAPILDYQFELSIERIKQQCLVLIYKMEMDISEKNECEGQGNQPTEGLPEKAWASGKKN